MQVKDLVAKWETAMRTLSRGLLSFFSILSSKAATPEERRMIAAARPADAGPTLADVLSTLGAKLDGICQAINRLVGPSHKDLLQEVEETKRALLSAFESQGGCFCPSPCLAVFSLAVCPHHQGESSEKTPMPWRRICPQSSARRMPSLVRCLA